ncbi:MAG: VWA domain-containing protein, partial [Pseudomonadota bacterium]
TLAQREEGMTDEELAAAKEELIRSYMKARTFSLAEPEIDVSIPDGLAEFETAVRASARYDMDTFFLKVAGFGQMGVPAESYAEQRRLDIEVALVLDVSGSMRGQSAVPVDPDVPSGTKMNKLEAVQSAATDFVNNLFDDQEGSQTLVSVVPYTSNVSANAFMASHFGLQPITNFLTRHSYSYCFEFETAGDDDSATVLSNPDYLTVPIDRGAGHQHRQTQHFANVNDYYADLYWGGEMRYDCPIAANRVLPYSNNAGDLTSMINNMAVENWTSTYTGVKWGAALLDPSSQPLVQAMIDANAPTDTRSSEALDSDYSGWPNEYDDINVHKYLIIMSDGRNSRQHRVVSDADYYSPTPDATEAELAVEQAARMQTWNDTEAWTGDLPYYSTVVNTTEGDALSEMICDALKDAAGSGNLTIFTIGYDISDETESGRAAIAVLQYCATNADSDFFNITGGDDPATAFDEIEARLSLLKLTQARR